jgi:glycosyltransferase involved in cell wall biosynthesis
VYEAGFQGHVLTYLRLLLPAIAELADEVVVALHQNAPASEEFREQLASLNCNVIIEPSIHADIRDSAAVADSLLQTIHRSQAQRVYVPRADGVAQILGMRRMLGGKTLPRDVAVEGLMFRGSFAYHQNGLLSRIKASLSYKTVKSGTWARLHYIDPLAYEAIQKTHTAFSSRCHLLPDPVESSPARDKMEARKFLGIPEQGRYIGFAGGADHRKGVDLLLSAFRTADLRQDDRLLIAGRMSEDIRSLVSTEYQALLHSDRLVVLDRYLNDKELLGGISAMDVVCTPYPRHIGSASFVIRAAAAERPVLAANFGWMGHIVQTFSLGRTCNVENQREFSSQIKLMLDEAREYQPHDAARRFVQFHSVRNFQALWTQGLRAQLNLPPAQTMTWDWVTAGGT